MTSADDELSILSISEDLVPSPTPIPSQQVNLSFDGLLNPPLVLQTNETQCGGKLWPAGMVLAEYMLRNKMAEVHGKTMFVRSGAIPLFAPSHLSYCGFIGISADGMHLTELSSAPAAASWGMCTFLLRKDSRGCTRR